MLTRLLAYLKGLLRRRTVETEVSDELAFHIEMETHSLVEAGLSPSEARRRVRQQFGSVDSTREAVRDTRATVFDSVWQDVRFSWASLRRSPAFVATAVTILALGIGINVAIFSIVDAVFLRPPPVDRPDELVYEYNILPRYHQTAITEYLDLEFFRRSDAVFSGLTAHWGRGALLAVDGETHTVQGEFVAANYFDVLGVRPLLGRTFGPAEDDLTTTDLAMVISYDLWTRQWKQDPRILGTRVRLDDKTFTIVGVTGPTFRGLTDPWAPSEYWVTGAQFYGANYRRYSVGLIGRLKPGVTLSQARAIVAVQNDQMHRERQQHWPAWYERRPPNPAVLFPISDVRTPFSPDEEVVPVKLATAVGVVVILVLVVATANIAGILRARGVTRAQEIAIRRALGAGALRLVRQLTTEALMLSFAGGVVGLLVASCLISMYGAYTPERFVVATTLDARVVLFTLSLCLGVGVLVGLAPAFQAVRVNVVAALGGGAGSTTRTRARLRHGIVIPQVAVSLLLLLMAGVHVRSLAHLEMADPGYAVDGIATLGVGLIEPGQSQHAFEPTSKAREEARAERSRTFFRSLLERIQAVPGTGSVALTDTLPVTPHTETPPTFVSQEAFLAGNSGGAGAFSIGVSTGYFETLDMSLRQGRDFDARDVRESPPIAVVSARLAGRLWPDQSAIGKQLAQFDPTRPSQRIDWLTVIGVVNDVTPILQPTAPTPIVYVPLSQQWRPSPWHIVARVPPNSTAPIASLRAAVSSADPNAVVDRVRTMRQLADEMLYPRRIAAGILTASGLLGLLLAAVGLHGVVSHSVAQRMREISIRMTVGAGRADILRLVLKEGAIVTAIGCALGLPPALIGLRLTANLVGAVPGVDAVVLCLAPLVVTAVVAVACYLPGRRAARADPAAILRGL